MVGFRNILLGRLRPSSLGNMLRSKGINRGAGEGIIRAGNGSFNINF